eukprot:gene23249-31575_t
MSDPFASLSNDSFGGIQQAKVLFDFAPQAINQISLKVGQIINITSYGGPGSWSQGAEIGSGKVGFFPSDYVQLVPKAQKQSVNPPPPPVPVVQKVKVIEKMMAKALYDFSGSGANEMSFKAGETFEVLEKGPAGAWSKGLRGAFPTDYVQFITAPTSQDNPTLFPQKGTGTAVISGVSGSNTRRSINTGAQDTTSLFDGLNVTSKSEVNSISTAPYFSVDDDISDSCACNENEVAAVTE